MACSSRIVTLCAVLFSFTPLATFGTLVDPSALGDRILKYLHARNLAMQISAPKIVTTTILGTRSVNFNNPDLTLRAAATQGYNVLILNAHNASGSSGFASAWENALQTNPDTLNKALVDIHDQGSVVLLGAFGDPSTPYATDATEYGTAAAQWALENNLDGLDFTPPPLSRGDSG